MISKKGGSQRIVIAGAGGHAKVVADLLALLGYATQGATDRDPAGAAALASGLVILGNDAALPPLFKKGVELAAVGVGAVKDTSARARVHARLSALGFQLPALVHPSAVVARSVTLGAGCHVMAGAIINTGARLGANCVVNTGAVVEHDCLLDDHVFVGPGALLGGAVQVGAGALIGLGACILPCVKIGANAVIGAGAVVLKEVAARSVVYGVPAATRP